VVSKILNYNTKTNMTQQEINNEIISYVVGGFEEDEIETVEENCGSFWITLKNGETWYLQVGKCEKDE
jgi:hypothetical protein